MFATTLGYITSFFGIHLSAYKSSFSPNISFPKIANWLFLLPQTINTEKCASTKPVSYWYVCFVGCQP